MKTDDELQNDVMAEIRWDPQLIDVHTQIGVAAKDGVVTLSGLVDSYTKKTAAEHAAQRVHGVKVVASDLDVKIGMQAAKSDTAIAEAVKDALRWNTAVNEDKIEVKVEDGFVYLSGEVEWRYQKAYAERSVENLLGVRGVSNTIVVKSAVIDTHEIKDRIFKAFHRNATIDADALTLETAGKTIILRGKVKSWIEKEEAERIAWSSPGVRAVDNQIEINTEIFAD